MDARFRSIAAIAARQHSVISLTQLAGLGVDSSMRSRWVHKGLLDRVGSRTYSVAGSEPTWMRSLSAGFLDLDGNGVVDGRSAARIMGLDGFTGDHVELLVPRGSRHRSSLGTSRSTRKPIDRADLQRIGCLTVVRAERLILDAPLFEFDEREIDNAIDSSIRLRLTAEHRLRARVVAEHRQAVNGGRLLLDAMVDTGGESRLERWFLRLCREAGLPRPILRKSYRDNGRTLARVDAEFPGDLIVEVAGHGTHATRRQRQSDAERHTELTIRGKRVLTFTFEDVRDRPAWVASRVAAALKRAA